MTTINLWGPLGNPSKEEIQKWWELPYGEFTKKVKTVSKKPRGKQPTEHTVYVTKRVYQDYLAEVKVMAVDGKKAIDEAGKFEFKETIDKLEYPKEPLREGTQKFFTSYKPGKCSW